MFSDRKKTFLSFASLLCINSAMTAGEIPQEKSIIAEAENVLSNTGTLNDTEATQLLQNAKQHRVYTQNNIIKRLISTLQRKGPKFLNNTPEIVEQLDTFSRDFDAAVDTLWQSAPTSHTTLLERIVATLEICRNTSSCILKAIATSFTVLPN